MRTFGLKSYARIAWLEKLNRVFVQAESNIGVRRLGSARLSLLDEFHFVFEVDSSLIVTMREPKINELKLK